jgi:hypothetical protein
VFLMRNISWYHQTLLPFLDSVCYNTLIFNVYGSVVVLWIHLFLYYLFQIYTAPAIQIWRVKRLPYPNLVIQLHVYTMNYCQRYMAMFDNSNTIGWKWCLTNAQLRLVIQHSEKIRMAWKSTVLMICNGFYVMNVYFIILNINKNKY